MFMCMHVCMYVCMILSMYITVDVSLVSKCIKCTSTVEIFDHVHAIKIKFDTSIALYAECILIIMNVCKDTHHMSMYLRL